MSDDESNLIGHLKSIEGNTFKSEIELLDTLKDLGVGLPKGYRSGSNNKALAKKEAERYIEYKPLCEVDTNYTKKRALIVTEVFEQPKAKEDSRGKSGRYSDKLKPLIIETSIRGVYYGTRVELFYKWGIYDNYREEQIKTGMFSPNKGHSFNPWSIKNVTPPGESKYKQIISFKERKSLEGALDSLSREGILEWRKDILFAPKLEIEDMVNSSERLKTWAEWEEENQKRIKLITELSEQENCILSPDLFEKGLTISKSTYEEWCNEYYWDDKKLPSIRAAECQVAMYENYQQFIRQMTVEVKGKGYCLPELIPNKYEIFTDWAYRHKYNELDKEQKSKLLGWEQIREEYYFRLIDEERAIKYLEDYSSKLPFELGREYILYMEEHMGKDKLYYPKGYTNDFTGVIEAAGSEKLFTLDTSKSARGLHDKLKKLFLIE